MTGQQNTVQALQTTVQEDGALANASELDLNSGHAAVMHAIRICVESQKLGLPCDPQHQGKS